MHDIYTTSYHASELPGALNFLILSKHIPINSRCHLERIVLWCYLTTPVTTNDRDLHENVLANRRDLLGKEGKEDNGSNAKSGGHGCAVGGKSQSK